MSDKSSRRLPRSPADTADVHEQRTTLDDLLEEMLAETGGPLSPEEAAAADRALGR